MPAKNFHDMMASSRPNIVLLISCVVLAVLCIILYVDKPANEGLDTVGRKLWGPESGSAVVAVAAEKNEARNDRKSACVDTLAPTRGQGCIADTRVWATRMGEIMEKALTGLALYDEKGQRVFCDGLTGTEADPPLVTVMQREFYPQGYENSVPAGKYLVGGYPVRMRVGSTDALVLKQFFCEPHFHFISYLGAWLPKDRPVTVVDAGSNIGLASILFAQFMNFNGEVLAIEANPSTLEILEENVGELGDVVTVVGAAIAPEKLAGSTVNFVGKDDGYWGFRVLPDDKIKPNMTVHKVPTKSLADIRKMSRSGKIDFLKIDIEGYEREIFSDRDSWPVLCEMRCIAAELHDWFQPGCAAALNKFLQGGCKDDPFRHISNNGEYSLYCRMKFLADDGW